jgi:uncharacterized protein (DUF849 family)
MLPRDRRIEWGVCNHGGDLRPLLDKIIDAGGHVAIGLGDFHYATPTTMTNAALITEVAERAVARGRAVAGPRETRAILEMT